jgi:hypothetical protein
MAACLRARLTPWSWECRARRERPRGVRGSVTRWRPRRDIAPRWEEKHPATGRLPGRGVGGEGGSGAAVNPAYPATRAYAMAVVVVRSSASVGVNASEPHARNGCSVRTIRASPDVWVPYKSDARGRDEVTRQLAALSDPRRRAGSCMAEMMRAAMASRNVRSGISEPGNGSGMSNPSPRRRGMRCTW